MPLLTPLLLLLLLTTLSLTLSKPLHLLNSPLPHVSLTRCLTPGVSTHTTLLRCSTTCLLHLHRHLNLPTETSVTLTSPTFSSNFIFPESHSAHTERLTLPNGFYNLTFHSRNPHSRPACGLFTYAFQHQLSACPIVLPTVLAPSPSPSPSPSPKPSRAAAPANDTSTQVSSDDASSRRTQEPQQITPRIVGGNIPDASLRTHMAAFIQDGAFVCSGSVISPRWALTAAHCGITRGSSVSIGGDTVFSGQFLSVQAAFPHPSFDLSNTDSPNDIALILFDRPAPEDTVFIRVNTNSSDPIPGAYARVAGYGDTLRRSITTLRQVDLPIVSMPKCKSDYRRGNPLIARRLDEQLQLCAGLNEGGCDACQGDSGGPLAFFDTAGHLVQLGIVSFGIGCARAGFPGVHTRLSAYEPWMKDIGAGFIRSSDGVTIFSTGSAEAAGLGGFSIAGLSTLQTILVLVGIAVVAGVLLLLAGFGLVHRARRSRATPATPPPPPQTPPPGEPQYQDVHEFDGYDPAIEQGLYPVYGAEYQYDGYTAAQPPPPPPPPMQPPPMQPPPMQPPPMQPPPMQPQSMQPQSMQPPPMQPPPMQPQSMQPQSIQPPPPVHSVGQGGGAKPVSGGNMLGNPAPDNRPAMSSIYPQNTVFTSL